MLYPKPLFRFLAVCTTTDSNYFYRLCARALRFKAGGGYIHGVIPEFFRDESVEVIYDECDKIAYTETMSERKRIMEVPFSCRLHHNGQQLFLSPMCACFAHIPK